MIEWKPDLRIGTAGNPPVVFDLTGNLRPVPICPDLLRHEQLGAADNWRGRVVRAFFWAMRWWPV